MNPKICLGSTPFLYAAFYSTLFPLCNVLFFGMCPFWNVLFLECALFGMCCFFEMCLFWNVPFLECALFGMCPFQNLIFPYVPFSECAVFGTCLFKMYSFWNVPFSERAVFFEICLFRNVLYLECALFWIWFFQMCPFWNVPFWECALVRIWIVLNMEPASYPTYPWCSKWSLFNHCCKNCIAIKPNPYLTVGQIRQSLFFKDG